MAGDYPSTDFAISEDGAVRLVVHLPTGLEIRTIRLPRDPMAVSSAYTPREPPPAGSRASGAPASSCLVDAQIREVAACQLLPLPLVSLSTSFSHPSCTPS